MRKEWLTYLLWASGSTLWLTICFILPYFLDAPVSGWVGYCTVLFYIIACGIGSLFLVYAAGCSRYLCAIVLPVLAVLGAALSFYRIGYHVTLTPMLIDITLHTNPEEAWGVISWQAVVWTVLNLAVAVGLVWLRWTKINLSRAWIHCLAALIVGSIYYSCNERLQYSLCQRFPYNVPYTISEYISLQHAIHDERCIPQYHTVDTPDSLTVVLILGEAVRADHLQLNGYGRATTPRLSARKNIVSYPHIYTDKTHTLEALPVILTRADSAHEEWQHTETSFVSVFRRENFKTAWISNQDMGSTFAHFLAESDTTVFVNAGKSVYVFSGWLDEELLPVMKHVFSPEPARVLYVLHAIGSHWYFNNHVPESMQHFQPVTSNKVVTANTTEQLTNSYDNTVLYMDFFVDSVIATVENKRAIVIYQSDHGEALGEDGYYLHANEAEAVKHPACIIWYSDQYAATYPDKIKARVANKDKRYRTDYVFHSILSAAGIESEESNASLDIFR